MLSFFFFQAEDGIRDHCVTGVQTCALPIAELSARRSRSAVLRSPGGGTAPTCRQLRSSVLGRARAGGHHVATAVTVVVAVAVVLARAGPAVRPGTRRTGPVVAEQLLVAARGPARQPVEQPAAQPPGR